MEQPSISKLAIQSMASLAGVQLTDEMVERISPLALMANEASIRLRNIELNDAEPSLVFVPRTGFGKPQEGDSP